MKKTLLIILIGFFSFQSFAQDPEFIQTWYLNLFYAGGVPDEYISEINPPISPYLTVNEDLTFSGLGACNTFTGSFSYLNGIYTVESFTSTNIVCEEQSHNDFEERYFNQFTEESIHGTVIIDGNFDIKFLNLWEPLMSGMKFSNIPFPQPLLFQTWYLTAIVFDFGEEITVSKITPVISPNLTIEPSLDFYGFGACNEFEGTFEYDEIEDRIATTEFVQTLLTCNYEEHVTFESGYFDMLEWTIGYQIETVPNGYSVLALEYASPGFFLIFQDTPLLSVNNFTETNIALYPNPVSDQL